MDVKSLIPWGRDRAWLMIQERWQALSDKLGVFQGIPGIVDALGSFCTTAKAAEIRAFFERNPVPTLVLHGPDDHVIWPDFPERCEQVFTELVGPFVVPRAGHFLQWERAELLNQAIRYFLA